MSGKIATPIRTGWWLITSTKTYRLSEPMPLPAPPGETRYVVVSTSTAEWESLAIACDEHGEPFRRDGNYLSLASVRSMDHDDAIRAMGFEVGPPEWEPEPPVEPLTDEQVAETMRQVAAYNEELGRMTIQMRDACAQLRVAAAQMRAMKGRSGTMKKLRLFLYSLPCLVAAALSASPAAAPVLIYGPLDEQVCDVSELHVAAARFEAAAREYRVTDLDQNRLIVAVSRCVFIDGERQLEIEP